jgi:hypothetical protein
MTEAEWLACTDPQKMLGFLEGKASDRKFQLLAAACGRSLWHLITDERSRRTVEVAERYVDGEATGEEMAAAEAVDPGTSDTAWEAALDAAGAAHAALVRDIFGNPFRPVSVDPSWLTWRGGTVPRRPRPPTSSGNCPPGIWTTPASPSWPTPWRMRVVRIPWSWATCARGASTCAAAGPSMPLLGKG